MIILNLLLGVVQVGYTNAGKSTFLNRLSGANVLAEDQLFATLDPTTRRVEVSFDNLRYYYFVDVCSHVSSNGTFGNKSKSLKFYGLVICLFSYRMERSAYSPTLWVSSRSYLHSW
jgi:hypothetical protein